MKTATEIQSELANFCGTENYYKYLAGLKLTDGVKAMAELCQAYWLLDIIASYQSKCLKDASLRDYQFWTLKKTGKNSAIVICERDSDDVFLTQKIEYTDFPLDEMKIWVENGVVLLPSEH